MIRTVIYQMLRVQLYRYFNMSYLYALDIHKLQNASSKYAGGLFTIFQSLKKKTVCNSNSAHACTLKEADYNLISLSSKT